MMMISSTEPGDCYYDGVTAEHQDMTIHINFPGWCPNNNTSGMIVLSRAIFIDSCDTPVKSTTL